MRIGMRHCIESILGWVEPTMQRCVAVEPRGGSAIDNLGSGQASRMKKQQRGH